MSERPFMQLYVSDFIGDTLSLSTEQVGAYLLLLMAMWNAGGMLPDDDTKLARICRLSLKKWKAIRFDLIEYFDLSEGVISHNRLTKELRKSESKSQSRASAGAKGGKSKSLKNNSEGLAIAKQMPKHLPDTRDHIEKTTLLGGRARELYEAAGITDETKSPGLLSLSEPLNWIANGCDLDTDVLPTLRTMAARGRRITSWAYCTNAVYEAKARRLAPAPKVEATGPPPIRENRRTVAEIALDKARQMESQSR